MSITTFSEQHAAYLALVYPTRQSIFYAQAPAFPGLAGTGASEQQALDALAAEVYETRKEGILPVWTNEAETQITTIILPETGRAYTVLLIRDGATVESVCPALGVYSDGMSISEALAMVQEAASLMVEDNPEAAMARGETAVSIRQLPLPMAPFDAHLASVG